MFDVSNLGRVRASPTLVTSFPLAGTSYNFDYGATPGGNNFIIGRMIENAAYRTENLRKARRLRFLPIVSESIEHSSALISPLRDVGRVHFDQTSENSDRLRTSIGHHRDRPLCVTLRAGERIVTKRYERRAECRR